MPLLYTQRGRIGDTLGGLTLPAEFQQEGVVYTGIRPCIVWFRGDLYLIGSYTRPIVRHAAEPGGFRIGGIRPPQLQLVVVPGTSSGGSSGACLAAITFVHKAAGMVLAESNFSNVVNVGALTGEGRDWSIIDNVTGERRVNFVRGYVSMSGASFRMAWEAPYGLASYSENVRTAQLTFVGPEDYSHLIPPPARLGHSWVGRMWYANTPQRPYRVWFSNTGDPQYVGAANFRDTLDREPVTALYKGRHELLVLCERASYMIRSASGQPGSDDFVMEKLDSDVGCINHHGIFEIHNKLWVPSEDGSWIYDGSFKYLMKEIQPLWAADWKENKDAFRNGFGMHDRLNKEYVFVTNRQERDEFERTGLFPGTVGYAGYYGSYEPSMAGESRHPEWMLHLKDRFDSAAFYNRDGELVIGSCDGKIRKQDATNGNDDGDLMGKPCIIRPGHMLFFEPGDELEFGKRLDQLWLYVESETTGWTINARGGDEQAWKGMLPDNNFWFWKADVAASGLSETRALQGRNKNAAPVTFDLEYVPQTVHTFTPEMVTGRGFMFELRAQSPIGLEYRGLGGLWSPSSTQRGVMNATEFEVALLEISEDAISWTSLLPGDEVEISGSTIYFRVTLAYLFGAAAFPIAVEVAGAGTYPISATGTLNGPGLVFTTGAITLQPGELEISVEATDENGVPVNPLRYPITVTGTGPLMLTTLLNNRQNYWPLTEASGARADAVGGANFTDNNGVSSSSSGTPYGGNAAVFNHTLSQFLSRAGFVFPATDWTLAFATLCSASRWPSLPAMVACGTAFPNNLQFISYGSVAGVDQNDNRVGDTTGLASVNFQSATRQTDYWLRRVVTYNNADRKIRVYINGVLLGTSAALAVGPNRTAASLTLGHSLMGVTPHFSGQMSEAVLASRVWTDDEIAEDLVNFRDGRALTTNPTLLGGGAAETYLTIGDSKTVGGEYQAALERFMFWSRPRIDLTLGPSITGFADGILATGGATVASRQSTIDADLAVAGAAVPKRILINLGANDVAALPAEATWNANLAYILDALHTKWPSATVYVTRPWRRTFDSQCDTLATRIATVISTRAWAQLGPDERVFLKDTDDGVMLTSDGVHPNTRGYPATAEAHRESWGY